MKKSILFVVFILLISVLPVAAHGGEEASTAVLAGINNLNLLAASGLLSLLMVGITYQITPKSRNLWQWGIVGMGTLAAFIHLGFGLYGDMLLLLNGLGYLSLLLLLILPMPIFVEQRAKLYSVLIVYTAITFLGYFVMHGLGTYSKTELLTKGIEICLIGCLIMELRQMRASDHHSAIIA